jgi:ABC-type dipeptide/oligopeptide/nickel transport system permease subunit
LALLFVPRAARAARDLWRARDDGNALRHLLSMLAAIFLPALFHGFLALVYIDYMGLGAPPPAPTLGGLVQTSQQHLVVTPLSTASLLLVLSLLAFTLFTPAAAVGDIVTTRRPLVHFNE